MSTIGIRQRRGESSTSAYSTARLSFREWPEPWQENSLVSGGREETSEEEPSRPTVAKQHRASTPPRSTQPAAPRPTVHFRDPPVNSSPAPLNLTSKPKDKKY